MSTDTFEIISRTPSFRGVRSDNAVGGEVYAVLHNDGKIFLLVEHALLEEGPNGEDFHAVWTSLTREQAERFGQALIDLAWTRTDEI